MIYVVELRYVEGDSAQLMAAMRTWLDCNRIAPEEFYHSSGCPGHAFRVGFCTQSDAAAFAQAFRGHVEGDDPRGEITPWIRPPSVREKSSSPFTVTADK